MTKYKLKKDLPFAKAGMDVKFNKVFGMLPEIGLRVVDKYWIETSCSEETFNSFIREGWIEEVKPREWYLIPNAIPAFEPYVVRSINQDVSQFKGVIKVIEVIE